MECHGNRFRTSDHSTVSLEPLKETLFKSAHMQMPDDTRGDDDDMCGVDRPTLSTS